LSKILMGTPSDLREAMHTGEVIGDHTSNKQ
jgi:hypothetical protein